MSGLRFFRQIVGLAWIGAFIWGVVSLFRGDWGGLGLAVLLWFALGIVFASVHNALQRRELQEAQGLLSQIAYAVQADDWRNALMLSDRMVSMLGAGANRDKTALGSGNGQAMMGPFAMALVGHALLLGANGRVDEAKETLSMSMPTFTAFAAGTPEVRNLIAVVRNLENQQVDQYDFIWAARKFHSFT